MNDALALTQGTLLGGRRLYDQPAQGYRTGIEPVLLAAAIPARPGERVLEGGTGAGAALLCLTARIPGLAGLGVERDAAMAGLAAHNLRQNSIAGVTIHQGDVLALPADIGGFDHACANPPWHAASGTAPADARRLAAKMATADAAAGWVAALAAPLRPGGTLTFILPVAILPAWVVALQAAKCGRLAILPLWPHQGRVAKLAILQAMKGRRGPARLLAGLVLHQAKAGYTEAAEAILRDGAALAV